jgi:outer membrane immunogenic protein
VKKLLLLGTALVAFADAGLAADLGPYRPGSIKDEPVPIYAPVFTWTGFYVGGHVGWGWSDVDWSYVDVGTNSDHSGDGFLGGVQVGYNWQKGSLVLGVEGDVSWADISGSDDCANPAFTCQHDLNWLASIRARAGLAANSTLFYVTGGVAWADAEYVTPGFGSHSSTETGWVAGGGIEHAFTPHWTARVEYLHYEIDGGTAPVGTLDGISRTELDTSIETVRLGINYKF